MKSHQTVENGGAEANNQFAPTSWTLVRLACLTDADAQHEALTHLLQRYLPPLRSHLVKRKRIDPHRAEDLLQDFVADKLLEAGIIDRAGRAKGKFRTFLLVALDRFVLNRLRDERAAKRFPAGGFTSIDEEVAGAISASDVDVNLAFNLDWARMILEETMQRMQKVCWSSERTTLWEVFHDRVVGPSMLGKTASPYAILSARFGFQSPAEAGNLVLTGRRMFVRLLHDVIAEYARDEKEIEEELADLRTILSRSG